MPNVMLHGRVKKQKPRDGKVLTCAPNKEHGATLLYFTLPCLPLFDHAILYGETIPHYIIISIGLEGESWLLVPCISKF